MTTDLTLTGRWDKKKTLLLKGELHPVIPHSINVSSLVLVDADVHSLWCVDGTIQWGYKVEGYSCNDWYSIYHGSQASADSSFLLPLLLWILLKAFRWKPQQSLDLKHELDVWGNVKLLVALLQGPSGTPRILLADCLNMEWSVCGWPRLSIPSSQPYKNDTLGKHMFSADGKAGQNGVY